MSILKFFKQVRNFLSHIVPLQRLHASAVKSACNLTQADFIFHIHDLNFGKFFI